MIAPLWIVIPAYNEASVLVSTVMDVSGDDRMVVVVDDGSTDNTATVARRSFAICLRHVVNQGQGAALQTGIDFALKSGAEYICTFDADGQHDSSSIAQMLKILQSSDVDVVLGTRFGMRSSNVSILRTIILKIALWFTRLSTGLPLTDTHNGLRMFRSSAVTDMCLEQSGMAHASEFLDYVASRRLKIVEIPTIVKYTPYSLAKGQKLSNAFRIAFDIFYAKLTK